MLIISGKRYLLVIIDVMIPLMYEIVDVLSVFSTHSKATKLVGFISLPLMFYHKKQRKHHFLSFHESFTTKCLKLIRMKKLCVSAAQKDQEAMHHSSSTAEEEKLQLSSSNIL